MSTLCIDILYSIFWLLMWIFITWPIAFIVAMIEVFFIPLCVCSNGAKQVCEVLDKVFKVLAYQPVENLIYSRPFCQWDPDWYNSHHKEQIPTNNNSVMNNNDDDLENEVEYPYSHAGAVSLPPDRLHNVDSIVFSDRNNRNTTI